MRSLGVTAVSGSNSATSAPLKGFVTMMRESEYPATDSTWRYYSPTNNSFYGVGTGRNVANRHGQTGTYNCLSFAVGIYTNWQWPWQSGYLFLTPSKSQILSYMSDSSRPGNHYYNITTTPVAWYTRVIYYDGDHFARVATYDSGGNPQTIVSKWGAAELIDSYNINPFFVGENQYGNAKYYIH